MNKHFTINLSYWSTYVNITFLAYLKGGLKIFEWRQTKKIVHDPKDASCKKKERKKGRKAAVDTRRWLVLTYSVMMDVRGRGGC